jgi:hypothetical protein
MTPQAPQWYAGRETIRAFFDWAWKAYGGFRLIPAAANRQPAFAAYVRDGADAAWARALHTPAGARARQDFHADLLCEIRRPAHVSRPWLTARPSGRGERRIAAHAAPFVGQVEIARDERPARGARSGRPGASRRSNRSSWD